jgi:succinoglycan biosynthesis protein ExoA
MSAVASAGDRVVADTIDAVMVVRDEPSTRLRRAIASLAAQEGVSGIRLVIAATDSEHSRLRTLRPHGAVSAIVLVDNPSGARSAGLNRAVAACRGLVVVRVDARSTLPADYVVRCVGRLAEHPEIGVVGGVQWPVAARSDARSRGIARALRNPWMLGRAAYRQPDREGRVDTVYLGVFRRKELMAFGGYDERLAANEDFELCTRYRDDDRDVWLEAGAAIGYEPRDTWRSLFAQYEAFGAAKVRFWRVTGRRPSQRQVAAIAAAAAGLAAGLWSVRRPARAVGMAAAACVGIATVDHLADPTERDAMVRFHSCAAYGAIAGGWLWGVVAHAFRSGDVEHALEGHPGPLRDVGVDRDLVDDLATHE